MDFQTYITIVYEEEIKTISILQGNTQMKTFIQSMLFAICMMVVGSVQALSADAPPVDWTLNKATLTKVGVGQGSKGYTYLTIKSGQGNLDQTIELYCKRGNPNLYISHNVVDVKGEKSEWATNMAIQYYAPGETKARDLFVSDEDFLIVGRQGVNMREALAEISKYSEGYFTFTFFSTGMHGEIFTNVISNAMEPSDAKRILDQMGQVDPFVCDTATGRDGFAEIYQQK